MPSRCVEHCANAAEAAKWLAQWLEGDDVALIKGSRGAKMEQIVEYLRSRN